MRPKAVILNPEDNVATVLDDVENGEIVKLNAGDKTLDIRLTAQVPFGHKFSISVIEHGSPVIKYGEIIGIATTQIHPGEYVHIHNVESVRGRGDLHRSTK